MIRFAFLAAVAPLLSACALLSSPDPVQMYRFGSTAAPPPQAGATPAPLTVSLRPVELPDAAAQEQLLAITGAEAAYIAGARWVSPAETLFQAGLEQAFAQRADRVRLLDRREPGTAPAVLNVVVTAFETRYPVAGAAPEVVMQARAQLRTRAPGERQGVSQPEGASSVERTFSVSQPAAENRVAAIVAAYDTAVRDLNVQIVDWTIQPN